MPMGSSERIPCFPLLAHVALAFPSKLSFSQPTSFVTFTLLILSSTLLWRSEQEAEWGLAAYQG